MNKTGIRNVLALWVAIVTIAGVIALLYLFPFAVIVMLSVLTVIFSVGLLTCLVYRKSK